MKKWSEAEAQRHLLPPCREGLYLVLFLEEEESDKAREMMARYSASVTALSVQSAIVVMERSSHGALASWFGIRRCPTLGAVYNGMLLAIECDCERGNCEEVLRDAVAQYETMVQVQV